ncbi:hypothetical protein Salat_2577400 [Sesamum alatum]|uniref:Uncharacterized protein n=1 Tax=Sesamum alatum TaxID=300844 RepID=A0AAE1XMP4_9LAMI|nr:hypothetical protein Salat_2577400 [Sesamum alatum]
MRRMLKYGPLVVISSLRIVYEHGYPPRVGAFAFTKESLSSVIRRSFLMDDEYCAVMIQMVLIIKWRCRRRLFNVPSVQTSSPSGEYRIGSHSYMNSKANQSYERALPRITCGRNAFRQQLRDKGKADNLQFEENSIEITADPFVKALFQLVHPIELNERLSRLDPSLHVSLLSISYRQNR